MTYFFPESKPSEGSEQRRSLWRIPLIPISVLTQIPVKRDVAMTGEITLRGNVLPIGGLKEKLLAALRGGIKTVLIPKENLKDLPNIPDNVKSGLEIIPAETVSDVLKVALVRQPEPIEWDEGAEPFAPVADDDAPGAGASLAH